MRLHSRPEWVEQYHARRLEDRLPTSEARRLAAAERIGADGRALLAPTDDGAAIVPTHAVLEAKEMLPQVHVVDAGYADSKLLVSSAEQYGIDLLGPSRRDPRWQAQSGQGFAADDFKLDWDHYIATCPMGHTSTDWRPEIDGRRTVTVRPRVQYEALRVARRREASDAYTRQYQHRAGVEGTLSYGVRAMGLRHSRYLGLARTHLQHVLTATAINVLRIGHWLGDEPRAQTRR